jgi:CHAT domain-containing protein
LPGEKNGSYLIESVRIASISVPRLIPEVLQELNQTAPEQSRLIAVGDVDFFAPAHPVAVADGALASVGKSQLGSSKRVANTDARHAQYAAVRTRPGHTYRPLPGTQAEVSKIGELADANAIQSIQMLTGARANESTIKRLAPTSTILHLATHGFFAGPAQTLSPEDFDDSLRLQRRQRRTEVHPGLMSGIACAGANQPVSTLQTREDGILTALEVASLDLGNVDLAVLSACSTGLGQATQGEGMLSLQRAFQIAGAESTVASLWEVNDGTTLVLMTEFYRNLWERRMSKLDALREAQLWMLRNPQQVAALLATRGGEDEFADENQITFAAPKFWAAWVLAGDWR